MSCQCGCGRTIHLFKVTMDTTKFTCRCGQEDWYHESRANTNEGPDATGRIHRIYAPCDPLVPMPGKPHLRRIGGEWKVIVHRQSPPWPMSALALSHAAHLQMLERYVHVTYPLAWGVVEENGELREMTQAELDEQRESMADMLRSSFVIVEPPQLITWTEKQDPTQW